MQDRKDLFLFIDNFANHYGREVRAPVIEAANHITSTAREKRWVKAFTQRLFSFLQDHEISLTTVLIFLPTFTRDISKYECLLSHIRFLSSDKLQSKSSHIKWDFRHMYRPGGDLLNMLKLSKFYY